MIDIMWVQGIMNNVSKNCEIHKNLALREHFIS